MTVANDTSLCSSTILVVSQISSLLTGISHMISLKNSSGNGARQPSYQAHNEVALSPCIVHDAKQNHHLRHTQHRVCTGPGKPAKFCKKCFAQVRIWNVWQTVRRINIEILEMKGLMQILESWKINLSQDWKSPGNCFWQQTNWKRYLLNYHMHMYIRQVHDLKLNLQLACNCKSHGSCKWCRA